MDDSTLTGRDNAAHMHSLKQATKLIGTRTGMASVLEELNPCESFPLTLHNLFQDRVLLCQGCTEEQVQGLFMILPNPNGSALVRPVLCSELTLPLARIQCATPDSETVAIIGLCCSAQKLFI